MVVADVFKALGDPVRLEIVQRLSDGAPSTLTTVSQGLNISRQGARKHLQVLVDSKVVYLEPKGRDTYVALNKKTLQHSKEFISYLESCWDKRLKALKEYVEGE